jgi:RNA polymerase sigma-70 factor (ECF subfamily)
VLKLPEWVSQRLPVKGASERALLLAVQKGDAKAAQALVQLLAPAAHALAWRMLGDTAGAQDVVQDALLKLLQTGQYQGEARLATYFHTIVTRLCLDRLRARKGSPFLPNEDLALLEVPDDGATDPQHRLAQAQQAQSVQQALMALAPRQRVALALWAYQDAQASDIARIMGLEVNAVHQLLHRAKINLRHQLGETHGPRP